MAKFQEFLHESSYEDFPKEVQDFARRCLLDLVGVAIAGSRTTLSKLICDHATEHFAAGNSSASILMDGRKVSPAGAALCNGMTIDSVDAHDGFKPVKGHVGCHVLPALLAFCEAEDKMDGAEFLASLIVGYEVGGRAGLALHASVSDYHTSGAWGAVTAAAIGSRVLGLDQEETREAIGIGEYHGPRSQMMRCIDYPTMLKDGSGWGAMAGVSAAYLAKSGFTGAPAITVEGENIAQHWADLGARWTILEQYFKAYPVCRWAQPAIEATISVVSSNNVQSEDITEIEVHTFHEGCMLATRHPVTTEQAQYSLPYPVAATLVYGKLGPEEISETALGNKETRRLSSSVTLVENDDYNAAFPDQRYAHVKVKLQDGSEFLSERHAARGDHESHLSDEEIHEKFHAFASPVIGEERSRQIEDIIMKLGNGSHLNDLLAALTRPA